MVRYSHRQGKHPEGSPGRRSPAENRLRPCSSVGRRSGAHSSAVRRVPGNGRPMFFRFQAVRHTSPIVNRSTREVAFLWKALTANDDLTFTLDDSSSRLSASPAWFTAPATAGVQAMKTGKPQRGSSGRIRTDQRNGIVRRQRERTQTEERRPGFTRLTDCIFCHVFPPAEHPPPGGKKRTLKTEKDSSSPKHHLHERIRFFHVSEASQRTGFL